MPNLTELLSIMCKKAIVTSLQYVKHDKHHNDTQHNGRVFAACHILALYAECRYPECHYAECRGANLKTLSRLG